MSEEYLSECVNCGRQVFLDGETPDEKCYWCHKPARIKEGNVNIPTTEQDRTDAVTDANPGVSAPPKTRKERLNEVRKLRGKRCLTCTTSYLYESVRYCPVKSCPSHIPKANRPPYRADESVVQAAKLAMSPAKAAALEKVRAARGNKCKTCPNGYDELDGTRFCLVKKCPYRLPLNLRAAYRELEKKVPAAGDKPAPPPATNQQKVYVPTKLCEGCELAIEYRGYRSAIRDLGGRVKN
jgi:hypothetical protein